MLLQGHPNVMKDVALYKHEMTTKRIKGNH